MCGRIQNSVQVGWRAAPGHGGSPNCHGLEETSHCWRPREQAPEIHQLLQFSPHRVFSSWEARTHLAAKGKRPSIASILQAGCWPASTKSPRRSCAANAPKSHYGSARLRERHAHRKAPQPPAPGTARGSHWSTGQLTTRQSGIDRAVDQSVGSGAER